MNIHEIAKALREIANALFSAPPCRDVRNTETGQSTCIRRETMRKLTAEEKRRFSRLPFHRYNVHGMCRSCALYWYAENAALEAEDASRCEREREAASAR